MPSPTAMRASGARLPWQTCQKPPCSPRLICSLETTPHQYFVMFMCLCNYPITLHPGPSTKARRSATTHHSGSALLAATGLERHQHIVAGAQVVVVDLAGVAFFARVIAVGAVEDAKPGAMAVVHEVRPAVVPDAVVPVPIDWLPGVQRQQGGGGQAFGLHPVVFAVIADAAVRRHAVADAAMHGVPTLGH